MSIYGLIKEKTGLFFNLFLYLNHMINDFSTLFFSLTGNDITDKGVLRLHQALDENSFTKTIW